MQKGQHSNEMLPRRSAKSVMKTLIPRWYSTFSVSYQHLLFNYEFILAYGVRKVKVCNAKSQGHLISNLNASEGFPLEGKLSPKVTDEVSAAANLQLFCQKIGVLLRFCRFLREMGPPHPALTSHLVPVAAAPRLG